MLMDFRDREKYSTLLVMEYGGAGTVRANFVFLGYTTADRLNTAVVAAGILVVQLFWDSYWTYTT